MAFPVSNIHQQTPNLDQYPTIFQHNATLDSELDFDLRLTLPQFYGYKPRNPENIHSKETSTSAEVQNSLLAHSQYNPRLQAALCDVFSDPGWQSQEIPIQSSLLRNDALRVKLKDEEGNDWWPCQLGCPNGIPYCSKGTKVPIRQATRAASHIEWHLGLRRFACYICCKTFTAKQDLLRHHKTHDESRERIPCPGGCGRTFVDQDRLTNINRHLRERCPNAS